MMIENEGILRTNQALISILHRILDIVVIIGSLFIVNTFHTQPWNINHTVAAIFVAFLFHFLSELGSLYISWRGLSLFKEIKTTTVYWCISASICSLALSYAPQEVLLDRLMIKWFAIGLLSLISYRVCLRFILSFVRRKGFNTRSFIIAGGGALGRKLVNKIADNQSLGLIFNGYYDDYKVGQDFENIECKGDLEKLVVACKKGNIDRVYITLPMRAEERIKWLMTELADSTTSVYIVPDIFMFELLHARSDVIAGIPTISIYDSPLDGSNAIVKRIEDLVLSALILLLISPIILAMSIAIKITSRGPILFKQTRYGIDGKAIEVWKFRSMTVMENADKVTQAKKNDVRLTPIGGFIRSSSLDELPQFFNVLQGRMSIVGPRPHAVVHNEEYRTIINGYMLRHKVKPGITGWAQVNGLRGETDTLEKMEKRIEYDLDYIRNWSLGFDLKIVISTVFKSFTDKNAY
ncbi:undecaprenyl-phosphate glucose phosphotransferase [Colwellia marinimaniae]|nr:undecaprenyl-phosphate glucose phosphotransferase [Colwellia marinimaniae]